MSLDFGFLFAKCFNSFVPSKEKRRALKGQLEAYKITTIIDGQKQRKPRFKELKGYDVVKAGNGKNNKIQIHTPLSKKHVSIVFAGSNNTLVVGGGITGHIKVCFFDSGGCVRLGKGSAFGDVSFFPSFCKIEVGDDCMVASGTQIYGHDQHVLLDAKTKKVLNQKVSPVQIGNHCWIGAQATILKGVVLPDHTIVGGRAVVTKSFTDQYTALGGNPAKVIKCGISWSYETVTQYLKFHKG